MSTTTRPRINRRLAVKIAQDVLAQLALNRYKATSGTYCDLKHGKQQIDPYTELESIRLDESFQTLFKRDEKVTCEVCALGSLFTSFVNLENQVTVAEVAEPDFDQMLSKLGGAFTTREILLMEYVFERGNKGFLVVSDANIHEDEYGFSDSEFFPKGRTVRSSRKPNSYRYVVDTEYSGIAPVAFTMGELRRAIAYGDRYADNNSLMCAIMKNVIRNNGRFVLPQRVR